MRYLLLILPLLLAGFAGGAEAQPSGCPFGASACQVTPSGGTHNSSLANFTSRVFWAQDFGNCTWNTSADVSGCINGAITAAAAAGGGTVKIPAGTFNVGTTITQSTSGVHIEGAGVGNPRDSQAPSAFVAITRLVWIGAAGGTLLDVEPTGLQTLYSADVVGVTFDCASLANICAKIASVSNSTIRIGVSEPRITGAWFTTVTGLADAPGVQENDIWVWSRSTNASYSPTGILIDGNSSFNVSYNRFWDLYAWYYKGDGIVFGSQDNNQVYNLRTYPNPGATGSPVIVAVPGYVMPSGGAVTSGVNYISGVLQMFHVGTQVTVQGYTVGSTLTAGGGNTGTAAVAPVTLTTNGTTTIFGRFLNYAATTGVAAGMDFSCAGGPTASGIANHSAVYLVSTTQISPTYYNIGAVASGQACTFTWGVTSSAVAGTYTLTATGATTWNITAPSGGHTQTGVSVSGGVLAFTDVVIPITGNAVASDTFTLVVPSPLTGVQVMNLDGTNATPNPYFAPGATGAFSSSRNLFPSVVGGIGGGMLIPFGQTECNNLLPVSTGQTSVVIGNCAGAGATTAYSFIGNGLTNSITGFAGGTVAGQNNSVAGANGFIGGGRNISLSGTYSRGAGFNATDRGRFAVDALSAGLLAVQGDAQTVNHVIRGTGATGSAYRLTADQLTAGSANCVNIPNNTAYQLTVDIVAFDHTTVTKNEAWSAWNGLLTRGANAASTAVTMATTPTPITNGTVAGSAIAATADTTNGCLNISFTPPTGNTDTWNTVARVRTVEVQ